MYGDRGCNQTLRGTTGSLLATKICRRLPLDGPAGVPSGHDFAAGRLPGPVRRRHSGRSRRPGTSVVGNSLISRSIIYPVALRENRLAIGEQMQIRGHRRAGRRGVFPFPRCRNRNDRRIFCKEKPFRRTGDDRDSTTLAADKSACGLCVAARRPLCLSHHCNCRKLTEAILGHICAVVDAGRLEVNQNATYVF